MERKACALIPTQVPWEKKCSRHVRGANFMHHHDIAAATETYFSWLVMYFVFSLTHSDILLYADTGGIEAINRTVMELQWIVKANRIYWIMHKSSPENQYTTRMWTWYNHPRYQQLSLGLNLRIFNATMWRYRWHYYFKNALDIICMLIRIVQPILNHPICNHPKWRSGRSWKPKIKPNFVCHSNIAISMPYILVFVGSWYPTIDGTTSV